MNTISKNFRTSPLYLLKIFKMSRQINKINTSRVSNLSSPAKIRRVANQLNLKNEKRIRFSHAEKLEIC
ncbi:hypothetical protein A0J61_11733 [Choanephora cucurbitarum]|uniref:Uncharacterized protein n=1 Tax=Choanephora cucurbitarum TaxID=101091 RepID=A0A1C7MTR8_9FUNG|nr:hypothetical protein A0J61_11733 [Choanephora cucurbitarum]